MKDRKEYWRAYQKRRYRALRTLKESPSVSQIKREVTKRFNAELAAQGLDNSDTPARVKIRLAAKIRKQVMREYFGPIERHEEKCQPLLNVLSRWLCYRAKTRAKAAGFEFSLTPKDLDLPTLCPVLAVPLDYSLIGNGGGPLAPSVDRINNSKGYIPSNVQITSWRANKLKNDATLDELILLGKWAEKVKGSKKV